MKTGHNNMSSLLVCIAEAVIGVLLLINPVGFTSGIIIALGVVLTILGIYNVIQYFRNEIEMAVQGDGLSRGILFILVGLFCIFRSRWFVITFPVLTMLYGVITLVAGVGKIQMAVDLMRLQLRHWYIALINALLTIVFALLIVFNPFETTAILWTFIGVALLIEALLDIIVFIFGRRRG